MRNLIPAHAIRSGQHATRPPREPCATCAKIRAAAKAAAAATLRRFKGMK